MKKSRLLGAVYALISFCIPYSGASAAIVTADPDDFAPSDILSNAFPGMTLS